MTKLEQLEAAMLDARDAKAKSKRAYFSSLELYCNDAIALDEAKAAYNKKLEQSK